MATDSRHKEARGIIRSFRPDDAEKVNGILADSAGAANWTEAGYREAAGWVGALALVAEAKGRLIGFIVGRQIADEAEILNLAVRRESRRRGEGEALLKTALAGFLERRATRVFLEVRESNETAIAFYAKQGFSKTGRRPGYYRDPAEAAVLMERKFTV